MPVGEWRLRGLYHKVGLGNRLLSFGVVLLEGAVHRCRDVHAGVLVLMAVI